MKKEHGDGLFRLLAPSVAGLLACVVCLCATSWAWFSASVTAAATTIHSASYTVNITIEPVVEQTADPTVDPTDDPTADSPVEVTKEAGVYSVKFLTDGEYTVTLTRDGNATTGYCKVNFRSVDYYTSQMTEEAPELQFTVHALQDELLTITPIWGTYTGSELTPITALSLPTNDPVETDPPEGDNDTVEPADESNNEDKSESTDETNQPDGDNQSGDSESTTPAEGDTPAGGESDSNSGDSGNPAPASDASESATESTQETPSDQTAFRFPTDWNGLSS